jgi:hypothetical protein
VGAAVARERVKQAGSCSCCCMEEEENRAAARLVLFPSRPGPPPPPSVSSSPSGQAVQAAGVSASLLLFPSYPGVLSLSLCSSISSVLYFYSLFQVSTPNS